ncbi:hypothetical protein [Haloferula rosea]|uniref:Uncharacterized protein n=1 Tax=Haloferula rosea TaxID=490093 RepID=A0A934RI25_9BACT|nr:hypothetical protein [Haloferula rosea]MBK1828690.1 hypothetical protein [Haloferula rosea]
MTALAHPGQKLSVETRVDKKVGHAFSGISQPCTPIVSDPTSSSGD